MAAHTILVALVMLSPAAEPTEQSAAQRTPHELRTAVREAMRQQATTSGPQQDAATRELVTLYRELADSITLGDGQKRELMSYVRNRLRRTSDTLARQLNKIDPAGARSAPPPAAKHQPAAQAVLAQVPGNLIRQQAGAAGQGGNFPAPGTAGAGAGAGGSLAALTNQNVQELIDLIQTTIAPSTWDVNGGVGVIRYFAPAQVLVVRQTGDVHGQVTDALGDLRKN